MFGIGGTELFIILLFGFLIFGPDKLPQMGRTIGRAMRQFRNAQDEMNKVIREEVYDPTKDKEPLSNMFDGVFDNAFSGDSKKEAEKAKDAAVVAASKSNAENGKAETFAERKARLAKEREEKRVQAEGKAAEDASAPADGGQAAKPDATDAPAADKPDADKTAPDSGKGVETDA